MLAYPLALLYLFEWLGYQEVVLPMRRDAPALYMQFSDQRLYVALALALLVVVWFGLVLIAPSFAWCAVPLSFVALRVLPFWPACVVVAGMATERLEVDT